MTIQQQQKTTMRDDLGSGLFSELPEQSETMRISLITDANRSVSAGGAVPLEGGRGAQDAADAQQTSASGAESEFRGAREVFFLRGRETEGRSPSWQTGNGRAAAVFTSREQAVFYAQTAGWETTVEVVRLAPEALAKWLREADATGIAFVAVDPNRHEQTLGQAQPALAVEGLLDRSAGDLFNAIYETGKH